MKRLALWTTYYTPKTEERDSEFIRCLQINSKNPHIDVMYVLCENVPCPIESPKIIVIPISERPSFNTFFYHYSLLEPKAVNVLINTDIIIDYRKTDPLRIVSGQNAFMLTRYEVMFPNTINSMKDLETARVDLLEGDDNHTQDQFYGSYDLWAIEGAPEKLMFPEYLGVPACDGRVAFHFYSLGYILYNPCLTIRIYHLHSDQDRSYYLERYKGDTVQLRPTNLAVVRSPHIGQAFLIVDESIPRPKPPLVNTYSIVSRLKMHL